MPLRPFPSPLALRLQRLFHTSAAHKESSHAQQPNHYETLGISPNASASEVKKSFYTLSKTHHPDRNPSDPTASERFVKISEAYTILASPEKRSKYDREVLHHSHGHTHSGHHQRGSYHSSGPVGGRPASGLSRRRTQFRGPPPSFYRSGGWGEHSAKRRAAQDSGPPGSEAPYTGGPGGMGPGQSPYGAGEMNDVPHFDREGHFRTQENNSQRWQRRRQMGEKGWEPSGETPSGTFTNLIFVGGIIGLGVFIPSLLFGRI